MRKRFIIVGTIVLLLSPALPVAAVEIESPETKGALLVEVQTGSVTTGTEEFVEIYNPGNDPIDITGWRLQYRPASALPTSTWSSSHTKATVVCREPDCTVQLEPQQRRVFANFALDDEKSLPMTGGFAEAGGQIRLIAADGTVQDMLGYGTAVTFEGQASAAAADAGQSMQRIADEDGYIDTDQNRDDWFVDCSVPTPGLQGPPQNERQACEELTPPEEEPGLPPAAPATEETPAPGRGGVSYVQLFITEVFPDPASPLQDSSDEFIEIYNPHDFAVEVEDYVIRTGTTWQNKVTLGQLLLPAYGYAVITSGDSSLSLSNSGTGVQLLDPNGTVRDEIPHYGKATSGHSWMKDSTGWHWTTTPTPAAANRLTAPIAKTAAAKKSSTAKKATPKTTASAVKTAATSNGDKNEQASEPVQQNASTGYWLLALVGVAAVGYGIYEYRQDIGRGIRKVWATARGGQK